MSETTPETSTALQVDDLALNLGEQRKERLINFRVSVGEVVTIAGPNGSGKSVLLSCLTGQRIPSLGHVRVFGFDVFERKQRSRAQSLLGVLFQRPGLVRTLTVFDNVALPFLLDSLDMSARLEQQIRLRLRLVGCEHLAGNNPENLSAGERRCVALARALSGKSRILLADEPVAELSSEKRLMIEELITGLVKSGALDAAVLFTQDLDLAERISSRYFVLKQPDREEQTFGGFLSERVSGNNPEKPAARTAVSLS